MLKSKKMFVALSVLVALTLVFAGNAFAAKKFFAIATGGTGGTYYPLGGILAQALTEKVPDVVVTAQAAQASVANCNLIRDHQIESAFVQSNVAYNAYAGVDAFKDKPAKNIRGIASLYPETIQIVARADSGIMSMKDIKGKRLVPGDRGSGTEVDTLNVLSVYRLTYKDFSGVDWLSFSGAAQRLQDKQADVTFTTAGWPTAAIQELAIAAPINLVPIDEAMIKELTKKFPFYSRIVIPKGTYKGQEKESPTVCAGIILVINSGIPEPVAYQITKLINSPEGRKKMGAIHADIAKEFTLEKAAQDLGGPLHPGAERYYREAGVLK